jgi:hypothetical protein
MVTAPTMILTGEPALDGQVPPTSTRTYTQWIKHARVETLEGTGHLGIVTKPEQFADRVCDFVDHVEGWKVADADRPARCEPECSLATGARPGDP